jgi:hypothetical protein
MTDAATAPTPKPQARLGFDLRAIVPPSGHIVSSNDTLFIRVWNSTPGLTLTVRGHQLVEDGEVHEFQFPIVPTTNRAPSLQTQPLANGILLDLAVFADAGAPLRGQCFVQAGIIGTGDLTQRPSALLISDYVLDQCGLGWPGAQITNPLDGRGFLRAIVGTDPAAGVEISETVPANARWLFYSMTAQLVTAVAVANRFPNLAFDDGANVYFRMGNNSAQAASLTRVWIFSAAPTVTQLSGTSLLIVGAPVIYLLAGHRLRTITENFQAADNWGAPVYLVEEWIEP